ncbi:MAG: hypothetical protein ACXWUD_03390 [Methylosarcina sp.]
MIKGSFKKIYKRNGEKQDLKVQIRIGKEGDLVTKENFNDDIGVLRAVFPGGAVCEFDSVSQSRKFFNYSLNVRVRKGNYQEIKGFCSPSQIPSNTGEDIIIEFDADDDALTTNTEVARIVF